MPILDLQEEFSEGNKVSTEESSKYSSYSECGKKSGSGSGSSKSSSNSNDSSEAKDFVDEDTKDSKE